MAGRKDKQQDDLLPNSPAQHTKWLTLWLGLTGVGMLSAALGRLLMVWLSSTPLLQHKLRPEEATVFDQQNLSKNTLGLPEINRSVNILVLGMTVLPDDLGKSEAEIRNIGYEPQMHSVEGLSDTIQLLRFDPDTHKLTILSIPRDTRIVLDNHLMATRPCNYFASAMMKLGILVGFNGSLAIHSAAYPNFTLSECS